MACAHLGEYTVIDYWLTPYKNLKNCTELKVYPITEYIRDKGIQPVRRLSDHSLVMLTINITHDVNEEEEEPEYHNVAPLSSYQSNNPDKPVRYRVKEMPPDFMSSGDTCRKFEHLIDGLILLRKPRKMPRKLLSHGGRTL